MFFEFSKKWPNLKKITLAEFEAMKVGAKLIEKDSHGEKVLRCTDGRMLKLFRRKRKVSSQGLYPAALRFSDNAQGLAKLGVRAIQVCSCFRLAEIERDIVHYEFLPGETLQDVLPKLDEKAFDDLLQKLAAYMAELHSKGVYFRSLHLGNVLQQEDGELVLIDISDMKIYSGTLNSWQRARNFRAISRRPQDLQFLQKFGVKRFFELYCQAAQVAPSRVRFLLRLQRSNPFALALQVEE